MAFRHFLEKAEWRNNAFHYFPPHSTAFLHFPPFCLFHNPNYIVGWLEVAIQIMLTIDISLNRSPLNCITIYGNNILSSWSIYPPCVALYSLANLRASSYIWDAILGLLLSTFLSLFAMALGHCKAWASARHVIKRLKNSVAIKFDVVVDIFSIDHVHHIVG